MTNMRCVYRFPKHLNMSWTQIWPGEKAILRLIMNGLDLSAGYGGRATRRRGGVTIWKELSDPAFS